MIFCCVLLVRHEFLDHGMRGEGLRFVIPEAVSWRNLSVPSGCDRTLEDFVDGPEQPTRFPSASPVTNVHNLKRVIEFLMGERDFLPPAVLCELQRL